MCFILVIGLKFTGKKKKSRKTEEEVKEALMKLILNKRKGFGNKKLN